MGLGYENLLAWSTGDGAAVANTTTPTSILSAMEKVQLQPIAINFQGFRLEGEVFGRISTVTAAPGTLTIDVRFGSVIVFTSQAHALNTTAKTNVAFKFKFDLEARAIGGGTSATIFGDSEFISEAVIAAAAPTAGTNGIILSPASAPAVGTGYDGSSAQTVDVFVTWSTANAANSITKHKYKLKQLNGAG